jgi:Ca2+-binding EF-hand superfamily protein
MTLFRKINIALLAAVVTVTGAGIALADDRGGKRGEMRFERLDADSDGSVTFAEFSRPMMERFNEADADGDGTISAAELEEALESRRAERRASHMIERFDIDGDERVSADEIVNRQEKMFALMDRDDSGVITEDELPRRFAGGKRRGD